MLPNNVESNIIDLPPGKSNDGKFVSKLLLAIYPDSAVLCTNSVSGAILKTRE